MALHLWFTFFLAYLATTMTPGPVSYTHLTLPTKA